MEGVRMNEKVTSKFVIARDFVLKSKCMFGGGLRPELLRELRRFTELIFRPQMYQKRLVAGLRPDPLGELERSPGPLAAVGLAVKRSSPVRLLPPTGFNHKSHHGDFRPRPLFVFWSEKSLHFII